MFNKTSENILHIENTLYIMHICDKMCYKGKQLSTVPHTVHTFRKRNHTFDDCQWYADYLQCKISCMPCNSTLRGFCIARVPCSVLTDNARC